MDAIIVDNELYVAEATRAHLQAQRSPQIRVQEIFQRPEPALEYARRSELELCVTDVELGPKAQTPAEDLIRRIDATCVAFTAEDSLGRFALAWDAGADGYALKTHSRSRFGRTVRQALAGRPEAPTWLVSRYATLKSSPELSERQVQWATLFLQSLGPEEIAGRLSVSRQAAYQLKHRVKSKLGCDTTEELEEMLRARLA